MVAAQTNIFFTFSGTGCQSRDSDGLPRRSVRRFRGGCNRMPARLPVASLAECAVGSGSVGKSTNRNQQSASTRSGSGAIELEVSVNVRLILSAAGNVVHGGRVSQVPGSGGQAMSGGGIHALTVGSGTG